MGKRVLTFAAAAVLAFIVCVPAGASGARETTNINAQNYLTWDASPVSSYLFSGPDGHLTRVERPGTEPWAIVEEYDSEYRLIKRLEVPLELPFWGGFFAGEEYNFFVFGQSNPVESDSVEVIRVVKYSKGWERLGQASLKGANTSRPFAYGSLRMAESGGMLYIRTCHQMYSGGTGVNAPANMTVAVRESDMAVTDSAHLVADVGCGYVSRSFNQFILTDSAGRIVALDQGDKHPIRAAAISIFSAPAGSEDITSGSVTTVPVLSYPLGESDQVTGASFGGFGETEAAYITAYNYDGMGDSTVNADRSVYVAAIDKQTLAVTTQAVSTPGASTPQLACGEDGGFVIWNTCDEDGTLTDTLQYVRFDATGKPGEVMTARAPLSDCAPLLLDGMAVWYVTDGSAPVFYELSEDGVSSVPAGLVFSDVGTDSEYFEAVMWASENGIVSGNADGTFDTAGSVNRGMMARILWNAACTPEVDITKPPFSDVDPDAWYAGAVAWCAEKGIISGVGDDHFNPLGSCDRRSVVTLLWNYMDKPEPAISKNPFSDVSENAYYKAILWAAGEGMITPDENGRFSPASPCTRGELVRLVYEMIRGQQP